MKFILPDVGHKNMYAFESEVEQLNTVKFECEFTPKTPSSRTSGLSAARPSSSPNAALLWYRSNGNSRIGLGTAGGDYRLTLKSPSKKMHTKYFTRR